MGTSSSATIKSVERSYEIVHALCRLEGARVNELAEHLDYAPSTVHKHLATLENLGYVSTEGDTYHVGIRFLTLGGYARQRKPGYRLAIKLVKQLATEVHERAQFVVEEDGRAIYLHTEGDDQAVMIDRHLGKRRYLHSSAAGKAILAHLPEDRIEWALDRWGLPAETDQTITDREELYDELDRIRSEHVAFNDEESVTGLRAVGVPVMTPQNTVLGAFSVSGPARRLEGDRYRSDLPNLLLGYANELELNLRNP